MSNLFRGLSNFYRLHATAIATRKPLNANRLLEVLQLLQLDPLIRNISAELIAGSRLGVSLLQVNVTPAKTFNTQVSLDNNRPPSIGSFEQQIQLTSANLLGLGDNLSFAYTHTDGSDDFDVSYTIPVNPRNGTVRLSYGTRSSKVIEEPFDVLNIEGDSQDYELSFRQPVVRTPAQELALGLTATRRVSDIGFLEGLEISPGIRENRNGFPSPGARNGITRLSVLRFFQDWVQRNSREVIAARSQFILGIGGLGATINSDPPDSRFFAWRGQAQWVRLLAEDTLFLIRADVQLADRALVPLEQIGLGGQETVRGYRQDLLLTDNGALASLEIRLPILRAPEVGSVLQIVPFVDFGTAWNSSGRDNPDPNTLASLGLGFQFSLTKRDSPLNRSLVVLTDILQYRAVPFCQEILSGLRWQQGNNLTARFDWGIPLVEVDSRDRTLQEQGLYFSVVYTQFF